VTHVFSASRRMTVSPTVIIGVAWATQVMHIAPASRGRGARITRSPEPGRRSRRLIRMRSLLPLVLVVGLLGACSDEEGVTADGSDVTTPPDQRYEASATVLEGDGHGPQLCLGGVATSLPPQCGGPDIVGWDWAAVEGEESANGTTWGDFHVVGTYADGVFTLTETPGEPQPPDDGDDTDFTSPCPEPAGGWAVVDPALATQAALDDANTFAATLPGYAGSWVDQSINPASADGVDPGDEELLNDPALLVLNVRFTGELDQREAELREHWGGALCVSAAEHTDAELQQIQTEIGDTPGFLSSGRGIENRVDLTVIVDDGSLQAELDDRYGEGAVLVTSALQPVDG
jgi:hypothetical protein